MAGDWLKIESETPDKPELIYMAGVLKIDQDSVFGKLFRVWSWFDKHTENGHAVGVTFVTLDRITGVTGFAEAMALVGWLKQSGTDIYLPNFDRHCGESAKKRALAAKRKQAQRSRFERDMSVTREEKRREEEKLLRSAPKASGNGSAWSHLKDAIRDQKTPADPKIAAIVNEWGGLYRLGELTTFQIDQRRRDFDAAYGAST